MIYAIYYFFKGGVFAFLKNFHVITQVEWNPISSFYWKIKTDLVFQIQPCDLCV